MLEQPKKRYEAVEQEDVLGPTTYRIMMAKMVEPKGDRVGGSRRGLEMLRREKELVHRDPGDDVGVWLSKLAELDAQEERLLDLYLEAKLEADRYERRAAQIREARRTVQDELARVEARAARVERLERNRDALLERYSRLVPERLDALEPSERNRVYRMFDLSVLA